MILWNGSKCLLKNGKGAYHLQKADFQNSKHRHLWDKCHHPVKTGRCLLGEIP